MLVLPSRGTNFYKNVRCTKCISAGLGSRLRIQVRAPLWVGCHTPHYPATACSADPIWEILIKPLLNVNVKYFTKLHNLFPQTSWSGFHYNIACLKYKWLIVIDTDCVIKNILIFLPSKVMIIISHKNLGQPTFQKVYLATLEKKFVVFKMMTKNH